MQIRIKECCKNKLQEIMDTNSDLLYKEYTHWCEKTKVSSKCSLKNASKMKKEDLRHLCVNVNDMIISLMTMIGAFQLFPEICL